MSEQLRKNEKVGKTSKAIAVAMATLALSSATALAGSKTSEKLTSQNIAKSHTKPSKGALVEQHLKEVKSFQNFGKLKNSLPEIIDTTLKQNFPGTLGFLPGKTAKYVFAVGNSHVGTSTLRMSYVKGDLKVITIAENQHDPLSFEPLENLEYTKILKKEDGFQITRQSAPVPPKNGINIGTSISTNFVPLYANMPRFDLAERRGDVADFNLAQRNVQVFLNDMSQFGIIKPTQQ